MAIRYLVASPAEIALNQNLFTDMAYDPLNDLTPVTLLAWTPLVSGRASELCGLQPGGTRQTCEVGIG